MTAVIQERLSAIEAVSLKNGSHNANDALNACVMEAVAYVAGEPWSDAPKCACPVITAFMVSWNDSLTSDAERDRLLKPLIPLIVGTRSTNQVEERRSYMALDWLIRIYTPKFLDLVPSLQAIATELRNMPAIIDLASATAAGIESRKAQELLDAVWTEAVAAAVDAVRTAAVVAARIAAGTAAMDAAMDAAVVAARIAAGTAAINAAINAAMNAAMDAAMDAAVVAARTAAGTAAVVAARIAAGTAAMNAARIAAMDAAMNAAVDALKPAVSWLQISSLNLVKNMVEVK